MQILYLCALYWPHVKNWLRKERYKQFSKGAFHWIQFHVSKFGQDQYPRNQSQSIKNLNFLMKNYLKVFKNHSSGLLWNRKSLMSLSLVLSALWPSCCKVWWYQLVLEWTKSPLHFNFWFLRFPIFCKDSELSSLS